jgi:hypothetical protein
MSRHPGRAGLPETLPRVPAADAAFSPRQKDQAVSRLLQNLPCPAIKSQRSKLACSDDSGGVYTYQPLVHDLL